MKTLHVMVGLPRSGKSTKIKELGYPCIELDAIRLMLHGKPYVEDKEFEVFYLSKYLAREILGFYDDVIIDDCNHTKVLRGRWYSSDWNLKFHNVVETEQTCIMRAITTHQEYLIPAIKEHAAIITYPEV